MAQLLSKTRQEPKNPTEDEMFLVAIYGTLYPSQYSDFTAITFVPEARVAHIIPLSMQLRPL